MFRLLETSTFADDGREVKKQYLVKWWKMARKGRRSDACHLSDLTDQSALRFEKSIAKVTDKLHTENCSLEDAPKERELQAYLQNIQLHATASGVEYRYAQLMWAWQVLDVEIKAVETMPMSTTTVQVFAE